MMIRRGRPGIKLYIEDLIKLRVWEDRRKSRKEWIPRKVLAFQIQQEIERMGEIAPELSTLMKRISDYSKEIKDLDPQEKPWAMATLEEYPELIPPQAIPAVLKVWKFRTEKGISFTIREAKWAARLSGLLAEFPKDIITLSFKASQYARLELIYQVIDRPFDSTSLDRLLMGLPMAINNLESLFPLLAEQKDGIDQIREYKQGKRKNITVRFFQPDQAVINPGLSREIEEYTESLAEQENNKGKRPK
jgi:hypothetical protein